MLLQIPETMPPEHYNFTIFPHGFLNGILFAAFAVILIIFGIIFFKRARKQEIEGARRIQWAFGVFGITYGITRILFILMFQPFTNPDQNYNLIASIAYCFGIVGFAAIIWALERIKYKKKIFFTIILITTLITIGGTIVVAFGAADIRETMLTIIFIGTPLSAIILLILYLTLIIKSTGSVKKKSTYSLLGLVIMFVGIVLDSQFALAIGAIPIWVKMDIVPIITIVGYLIFAITQF